MQAPFRRDSRGTPPRVDRAAEAMSAVMTDLRQLNEVTMGRVVKRSEREEHHSSYEGQSVAAGLLSKAEKMTEIDVAEACQSVCRSLEGRLSRFVDLINGLETSIRDGLSESDRSIEELRGHWTKVETAQIDTTGQLAKLKTKLEHTEERLRVAEASIDNLQEAQARKDAQFEAANRQASDSIARLEDRLAASAKKEDTQQQQISKLSARVDALQGEVGSGRLEEACGKIMLLERYNTEFMERSKRSTGSFEAEVDSKLSSLDARYASLLKYYHTTLMAHVSSVQEGIDMKTRSLHAAVESDVNKVNEDLNASAHEWKAATDKLAAEVKTLNRRLLNGLRLLKDSSPEPFRSPLSPSLSAAAHAMAGPADPYHLPQHHQQQQQQQQHRHPGHTTPNPPRKQQAPTPQTHLSAAGFMPSPHYGTGFSPRRASMGAHTAEIDQFLRGLEQLTGPP